MCQFQGSVDFSELGPECDEPLTVESGSDAHRIRIRGCEIRWDPRVASVAHDRDVIAVAAGRVRPSEGVADEAVRWLHRYTRDAEQAANRLSGGFSAVIIDFRRRRVLLFVDRFSIEALCYRFVDGKLGFADTAFDVPGSSRVVESQAIYDYLYFHVIPTPQTVFADVQRLEPAHRVAVSAHGTEAICYWAPEFVEDDRRDLRGRLHQFVDLLKAGVDDEADTPSTACFLSGGTDSSTVAGLLAQLRGSPVHAYSIGFQADGYDEMEYARIAARHFKLVHHELYITPDDLVEAIPRVAASFDQPFGNSSALPAYYCAMHARKDGFTRMLAGDGGDELFGGNSRYAMQKLLELYQMLPRWLRGSVLEPAAGWALFREVPGLRYLGGYVRHSRLPMPERLQTFQLLDRLGEAAVFDPRFRTCFDAQQPLEQQRATWNAAKAGSLLNRMLAFDWKFTLADSDLPKVRSATQLAGVGVGYPFLGSAMTDFSLILPPDWKLKRLKLRWFFKEALRDFLPAAILRKKKHGFGLPFGHWMLQHSRLREFVDESLQGIAGRGILREGFTTELLQVRLPQAPGYYGSMVWVLMMLEQWLREHDEVSTSALAKAAPGGDRFHLACS